MKKTDYYRNYVIEAMRLYAQRGRPDAIELRRLMNNADADEQPAILDMCSVRAALDRLAKEENGKTAVKIVDHVYLWDSDKPSNRTGVNDRVQYIARQLYISETTAYRFLRRMRYLVAEERGLRTNY